MFGWKGIVAAVVLLVGMLLCSNVIPISQGPVGGADNDEQAQFVAAVVDDVQGTWDRLLPQYRHAKLVMFRNAIQTACGTGQAAVGPFYCPLDERVYLDLSFFDQLERQLGAPGDFAQAYVIGHEFGHHVQNVLGLMDNRSGVGSNAQSVRIELMADCLAGVWAHDAARRGVVEVGDPEEALRAAASVGDDTLQERSTGGVRPETFTHGSSEQRMQWLRRGMDSGDISVCDTGAAGRPGGRRRGGPISP